PDVYQEGHCDKKRVVDQIKSAIETTPWGRFRKRVRIIGEIIVHNLDRFFDIIVREGIDETDFLFNFRVDNFIKNTDRIERALKIISETRNRFFLALAGIENFSNIELERYNKGFKNYDIFKFLSIVFELKHKYQNHFDYQEYGGFSLILFNPFTRVEDLRLNYHLIKYLGIENVCGKLFTSRLRLYEELPLYYLVRNEGLIVDKYKRKNYYTARYNFYKEEVPWRYKDSLTENVNRYLFGNRQIGLDNVIQYLHRINKPKIYSRNIKVSCMPQATLDMFYKTESEFMRHYTGRQIGKLEFNNDKTLNKHLFYIKKYFKYYKVTVNKSNISYLNKNIFYSHQIDLNSHNDEFLTEKPNDREYYFKIGSLLGYPVCCSEHYTENQYYLINNYLFILLYMRYTRQKVSELLNPFCGHFFFIPCGLNCKKAEEFVISRNNVTKQMTGYDALKYICLPVVFLLPFDPNLSEFKDNLGYVIVEPKSDVDDEFSYKPILYSGSDRRLRYILLSDRLVMKDGFMELYKGRRHIHTFCAEANVWYYKKPLDYKFWKEFSEAYYKSVIYHRKFGRESDVCLSQYADVYAKIEAGYSVFRRYGYEITDKSVERNVAVLCLAKEGKSVEIRIQNLKDSDKYFRKGRKYSVSIGRSDDNIIFADEAASLVLGIIEDEK
ncbi:MAG: DUF483 domain-containing protein, partial [Deltaproteobacteria bacterium]|nr:DUF483 domain-containing protein [Deltaproteobacteria bacterium]